MIETVKSMKLFVLLRGTESLHEFSLKWSGRKTPFEINIVYLCSQE